MWEVNKQVKQIRHDERISRSRYPSVPRVAVGAIVFKDECILLVWRGNPPASGQWAIPGGSVILGESLQEAAEREIFEETRIRIRAGEPSYVFDVLERDDDGRIRYHYVIIDLDATYRSGEPSPGDDALEARWVGARELENLDVSLPTRQLLSRQYDFG